MDVVEDVANICNYNVADDDESKNNNMDDETPLPIRKPKRIPILPTHKWEDGGYGQRLSHRCRSVFVDVFVAFSPNLGDWACVFDVCVLFSCGFLSIGVCVWNELFCA